MTSGIPRPLSPSFMASTINAAVRRSLEKAGMIKQQIRESIQQNGGALGASVTGGAGFAGVVAKAIPILQAVSFTVSIVVGVLTAIWYVKRIRNEK